MRLNSRNIVDDPILTPLHRLRCPKLLLFYTLFCRQRLVPTESLLLASSLWYSTPIVSHRKYHKFSTVWGASTYMFASP